MNSHGSSQHDRLKLVRRITSAALLAFGGILSAQQTENKSDSAPKAEVLELNPFVVNATEDYRITSATAATRLATALKDIPQTVLVVGAAQIQDTSSFEFRDIFEYTPGVSARQNNQDGTIIHGFTNSARYRNGFTTPAYASDVANVERVEVVVGPAAAIAGKSNTGGYINVVTKQPTGRNETFVSAVAGSDSYLRGVVDNNGRLPLKKYGSLDYRLIIQHSQGDGFRFNEKIEKTGIYPTLRWNLSADTTVTLEAEFQDGISPSSIGQPYYPGKGVVVPVGVTPTFDYTKPGWLNAQYNLNEPNWNWSDKLASSYLTIFHSFNRSISARQAFYYVTLRDDVERTLEGTVPSYAAISGPDAIAGNNFFIGSNGDLWLARMYDRRVTKTRSVAAQGEVNFLYDLTSAIQNRTLVGYILEQSSNRASIVNAPMNPLSAFYPVYGNSGIAGPVKPATDASSKNDQPIPSYFINHQSQFLNHRIIVTLGERWDFGSPGTTTNNLNGKVTTSVKSPMVRSPMAGLAIRPVSKLTFYGVYSQANAVAAEFNVYYQIPGDDPRQVKQTAHPRTTNKEFGLKADLNDNVSLTVSHYNIMQLDNRINLVDPSVPGGNYTALQPGNQARGWQLSASGRITESLEFIGGFDHTETSAAGGLHLRGVPTDKLIALAKYKWSDSAGQRWSARVGFQWQEEQWGNAPNSYKIPSAHNVDLGLSFTRHAWTYDIAAKNVTDTPFAGSAINPDANTVNPPRRFFFTASTKF